MQAPDFEYETIGPSPSWLISLGVVVDEWVQGADVRRRFQEMIGEWYKDLRRRKVRVPELPPRRALTLREQYAVLSAIHNVVCKRTKELGHWPRAKMRRYPYRWIVAIPWAGLEREVEINAARHKAFIETVFRAVESDLAQLANEVTRENGKQHDAETRAIPPQGNSRPIRKYHDPSRSTHISNDNDSVVAEISPSSPASGRGLRLHEKALLVFWNGTRIDISPNTDFVTLKTLFGAGGAVVAYTELLQAIDPTRVGANIALRKAPQEVKDIVSAIRKAFQKTGCPYKVENVASQGYRLTPPTA